MWLIIESYWARSLKQFSNFFVSCRRYILVRAIFSWRRQWHPTPVLLPGEPQGQRSLAGCSPWGHWESDTTERLHFHFSLSYIGEGNGNPLQCSCLENPRTGEPGGLQSMGSHRVGHDWSDLAAAAFSLTLSGDLFWLSFHKSSNSSVSFVCAGNCISWWV